MIIILYNNGFSVYLLINNFGGYLINNISNIQRGEEKVGSCNMYKCLGRSQPQKIVINILPKKGVSPYQDYSNEAPRCKTLCAVRVRLKSVARMRNLLTMRSCPKNRITSCRYL